MQILRSAAAAAAAALLAACTPALPAERGPAAPAPASWTAASPAGEIAAWAWGGCRGGERIACVERALTGLIDQAGIAKSMEVLDTLVVRHAAVRDNAHALAHGLGIAAYRSPETVAETFAACPPSQMSGCYHGVIQGYFLALGRQGRGAGTAELDALCAPHRESPFLFYQCVHGMGHGLMVLHGNHLPATLEACDLASDGYVRRNCYGGAFMENVVLFTHPHHSAEGHAGTLGHGHDGDDEHAGHGGEHAGHGDHGMDHGEWVALDPARPLYPCTEVAERYQEACYTMQSSAILFFNGGDVAATARACDQAPAEMVATCIASLGRDVMGLSGQDHRRAIELCGRTAGAAAGRAERWCLGSVAQNLVNVAADPDEGLRFCRLVAGEENKRDCYRIVGETISTLVPDVPGRAARCAPAEPEFAAVCRRGAGAEAASS